MPRDRPPPPQRLRQPGKPELTAPQAFLTGRRQATEGLAQTGEPPVPPVRSRGAPSSPAAEAGGRGEGEGFTGAGGACAGGGGRAAGGGRAQRAAAGGQSLGRWRRDAMTSPRRDARGRDGAARRRA